MRGYEFLDKLTFIDDDLIEAANKEIERKHILQRKIKYYIIACATAASICLILSSAFFMLQTKEKEHKLQQWTVSFSGEDYFKYNDMNNVDADFNENQQTTVDLDYSVAAPYDETRFFSDRKLLEKEQIIPIMEHHPDFICSANYFSDGSLYNLKFTWHCREDKEYSSLSITAGYKEQDITVVTDTVEVDENGVIIEPRTTITERDGIRIVAKGNKNRDKTLTFQKENGWYQIEGSWNDSYSDMAMLLDWIWEHPIDFKRFPMEEGDHYTYVTGNDYPDAFKGYIPDSKKLGYEMENKEDANITLKNGELCSFDGYYSSDTFAGFSWHIDMEPDYYEQKEAEALGDIENLTLEMIANAMKEKNCVRFLWDQYCISIYINSDGTPEMVWNIIKSVQESNNFN